MKPYGYLNGTLRVLVVEDDQTSAFLVNDILSFAPLYFVEQVSTCTSASDKLSSASRYHVAVLDLGIRDVHNDEFHILKQFSKEVSVIVFTGSDSPRKGAWSMILGAKAVVEKGASLDAFDFFRTVNRCALINIINRSYTETGGSGTLWTATRVLLEKKPATVNEWAEMMGITDRQLRNVWNTGGLPGARNVIFLHQLYSRAFSFYENSFNGASDQSKLLESNEYQRFTEYYLTHRQLFSSVLL
ncbi:MAG: response regulator [Chitinispirillaceae bacterium]